MYLSLVIELFLNLAHINFLIEFSFKLRLVFNKLTLNFCQKSCNPLKLRINWNYFEIYLLLIIFSSDVDCSIRLAIYSKTSQKFWTQNLGKKIIIMQGIRYLKSKQIKPWTIFICRTIKFRLDTTIKKVYISFLFTIRCI